MTKKLLSLILVLTIICSMFTVSVFARTFQSTDTQTGCMTDGWSTPNHVYTSGQTAKLRICTFNQAGKRTSGKIQVKAVADSGATYTWKVTGCNGISNSSTNITLPKGNTHYKVYIKRNGRSNSNRTKTCYWSIDFIKNCWGF